MKIGIVSPLYYPNRFGGGGGETSVKLLAEGLVKKGHKVIVLTFDGRKNSVENIDGVDVVRYKTLIMKAPPLTLKAQLLTLTPYVYRAMREWEDAVDIYHVYNMFPLAGAGLYKLLGGKRNVVATLNGYIAICPTGMPVDGCKSCNFVKRLKCLWSYSQSVHPELAIERWASFLYLLPHSLLTKLTRHIDKYIALSEYVKKFYTNNGFNEEKIVVIPNFINIKKIKFMSKRMKADISKRSVFNILYVGSMDEAKGVSNLIEAYFKICHEAGIKRDTHLTLVGSGPRLNEYINMVKRLKIENEVTFAGRVDSEQLCKFYLTADVFVHPAVWPEPFGRVILEALLYEVPIIVSNRGAPPEIIEDGGLIFEGGNVESLKKTMSRVIEDERLRGRLKLNHAKIVEKYNLTRVLERIINLYEKFVNVPTGRCKNAMIES